MQADIVLVVVATTAAQTLITMSALLPSAIAPDLAAALGVPTAYVGYQIALVYGGAMATSTIGGTLVRRWGACRISQAALGLCGLGILVATFGSVAILAAASLLVGLGYGLSNPASSHLLEKRATARNRNLLYSIKQTGVPLGGIAAGLIAPPIALAHGWPWAFAVIGAAALAAAAALQGVRAGWDDDRRPRLPLARAPFADLRLVWRAPVLRRLSLAALCFAATQLCVTSFLVALLVEDLSFGLIEAGALLSAVQAAGFAGRIFWGWIADRLGSGLGVLAGMTLVTAAGAVGTALLTPDAGSFAVHAVLLVFGFTAIGWNGVYLAEVARAAPSDRIGSATGGSLVFTFGGVLAGPPAFTLAYGIVGSFAATFALVTLVALAGLLFVVFALRGDSRASRLRTAGRGGKIAPASPEDGEERTS